jgi:hypothetical protein
MIASKDTGVSFLSEIKDRVTIESIAGFMAKAQVVVDAICSRVKVYWYVW